MKERRENPRIRVAQLARLHEEAVETAMLANLLGRVPSVLLALSLCSLVAAILGTMPVTEIAVWFVLMLGGMAALWRAWSRADAQPFELPGLRAFSSDLSATMLYAGFAWGSGAVLVLPSAAVFFAMIPAVLIAVLLRAWKPAILFVAPAAGMAAFSALLRPTGGLTDAVLVVAGCSAIAALSYWSERLSGRMIQMTALPALVR
jgi:hypothetical protein